MSDLRLGIVTQTSPTLRVQLNGDLADAPAQPPAAALTVGTEVVVALLERRRFVIHP